METSPTGLRERKKRATRARIADAALRLFAEQGFDHTTVAEVAAAADVSVKTVFNYFPAKEDLFFDSADEVEQQWVDAVADRTPSEPPLAGLRRRALARFSDHPSGPSTQFRRVMAGSAALQGRGQQMWARHEDTVATALTEVGGLDAMTALVVAHQVLAVHPLALRMVERWTEQGAPPEDVRTRVLALIERSFDLIERGLRSQSPSGTGPPPGAPQP